MKALMIHTENTAVGYYRIWMQAKHLRSLGWQVCEIDHSQAGTDVDELERLLPGTDIIITQRLDDLKAVAFMVAARDIAQCPLVIDIDDNIFDVSENSPAYQDYNQYSDRLATVAQQLEAADAVTVSTPALKLAYAHLNSDITVLRNCQDPEDWRHPSLPPNQTTQTIIGWAGSPTHYDDLKLIEIPMKRILKRNPDVTFRMLGMMPDFLAGHPQVECRTDIVPVQEWQNKLSSLSFDIGIVPLVDRPFNTGKSNIKWQEYAMLGIPAVVSPVGEYRKKLLSNATLYANTSSQWENELQRLISSKSDRFIVGNFAQKAVHTHHNIETNIHAWHNTYNRIITAFQSKLHAGL